MKSDSTTVIKNMEFLVKELHKEWDRSGASKASVIISLEEVDGINNKLKMRTQVEWNVDTQMLSEPYPTSWSILSRISPAALFVKVIAIILYGFTPFSSIR